MHDETSTNEYEYDARENLLHNFTLHLGVFNKECDSNSYMLEAGCADSLVFMKSHNDGEIFMISNPP